MYKVSLNLILFFLALGILPACNQSVKFGQGEDKIRLPGPIQGLPPEPGDLVHQSINESFPYQWTRDQFQQGMFDENNLTVVFRALDANGKTVKDLKTQDVEVKENGSGVSKFTLSSDSMNNGQKVDIVFALDITGSMDAEINSVKQNVSKFVRDLTAKNVKSSVCLLTFKDKIEKKCDKFVIDDPTTTTNENLNGFLDELSRVKVSGGGNRNENSMGAIVSAANDSAWNMDTQRMIIMITDAGFWILPKDNGESEARWAPEYPDVLDSITNSQAQVFVVGPDEKGYNKDYDSYPSVTKHGNGSWFDIEKLRKGRITMDDIFNYINDQVTTNYTLKYGSIDNGLDPRLPLGQRRLMIMAKGGLGVQKIDLRSATSNMPNGHPELKKNFVLNKTSSINEDTLSVYVNGNRINSGYSLVSGELVFDSAPDQGALVEAEYELGSLIDNVRQHPLILAGKGRLVSATVKLNGLNVGVHDYQITQSHDGTHHLQLRDSVFSDDDPYDIRAIGKLLVSVQYILEQPVE
jgi:hypothetical protein